MTDLKSSIKDEARHLGFELVGVTTPDPPPRIEAYEKWIKEGKHGQMGYLAAERARQRRADPRLILPECRSVLVLGMRYPSAQYEHRRSSTTLRSAQSASTPIDPTGQVASYAWGADYHEVIIQRLKELVRFMQDHASPPLPPAKNAGQASSASQGRESIPYRIYTDTGPILERELAQRAGLGWIGKNTCLIHPRHGSYFFLAEVFLGIELEPDAPFQADHCGSCTRCLEACPTSCILPDRSIDARRCISYLTIELKGAIPVELRHRMGNWVFGCDVCQQVCPWNRRFSQEMGDSAFDPRPGIPFPDLVGELGLTRQAFREKFKGNPVKRTKCNGYLRNIITALGNSGNKDVIPDLDLVLQNESDPILREHSAWAVRRIDGTAPDDIPANISG